MGQWINRSDQHDHPRIHLRHTRHWCIGYWSWTSESLHGMTLENIVLPPRPCHDLGSFPLPWLSFINCSCTRHPSGMVCICRPNLPLIPSLNFLSSLAVAACLTPTDPILAAAVLGGKWADKHVPAHIQHWHFLAAESGCNNGAAFPFLFIALYLTLDATTGADVRDWFLILWLCEFPFPPPQKCMCVLIPSDQIALGTVVNSLLGFGFRHLMKFCQRHDLIDRHSYVAQYASLAMLTIGITTFLGSDDLLTTFFCGTAFAWDGFLNRQAEQSVFSSVIDTLFNVAAFIFVGAWMPFDKFQNAALTLSEWSLPLLS